MNHAHDVDLTGARGVSALLSQVIAEVSKFGTLKGRVDGEEMHYTFTPNRSKQHPIAEEWNNAPFWWSSTAEAKKKGWNWLGDAEVIVRAIHASSAKELLASYIIYTEEGWIYSGAHAAEASESWKQFWDKALRYEHDLPQWPGSAPTAEIMLKNYGNQKVMVAEKGHGTYYAVTFETSS